MAAATAAAAAAVWFELATGYLDLIKLPNHALASARLKHIGGAATAAGAAAAATGLAQALQEACRVW